VVGAVVSPRTWESAVHVVLSLVLGVISFTVVVTGLALSVGLAVTVVLAIPVLWLTLAFADVFGEIERARFRTLLGVDVSVSRPPPAASFWRRFLNRFTSASSWKRVGYAVILLPLGTIGFSLVIGAWAGSLTLVGLPLYVRALPNGTAHFWLVDVTWGPRAALATVAGLVGLVAAAWITRGWAALEAGIARGLLGLTTTAVLEQRVDTLEVTRAQAVDAADAERRRIERDLHDGAQQRLVALAMDLGMAREKFDSDPEQSRRLIDEAHGEAKRALVELRDLAKGIHPTALTDRGLPGAVPALADRSPVPVAVHVDLTARPPASIEGMAYFIVSESLTNVAKHARATRASVDIRESAGRMTIVITDDGIGGADPLSGSGLRGLAERAASVDGRFEVSSPLGGPTVIRVELPCG